MRERWTRAALRRTPGLLVGLVLFGLGIALMARSDLGLGPWEAFHQGIGRQLGLELGTVSILLGVPILLAWWPLGERPGPGTLLNIVTIGSFTNIGLALVPPQTDLLVRAGLLVAGLLTIAVGSGLYLAADLGPGPRDGLMTGLHRRFGWSIARARTLIEVSVLIAGWALGGTVGLGTILFAFGIGPLVDLSLRLFDRHGRVRRRRARRGTEPVPAEGAA